MRIRARGIDPATGEPDRHGIPQISCPARQDEVNPQFTCRSCPCAAGVETHQAVDDLGQPFHMVNAVDCAFEEGAGRLPTVVREFPNPLAGVVAGVRARIEPGVACPLLASPERIALVSVSVEGIRWTPTGNCLSCQFYRGVEGGAAGRSSRGESAALVVCSAPPTPRD